MKKEPTEETREKADPRDEKDEVIRNNFGYFREKHPEIYDAYERFGKLVHEQGGPLDEKTRWLIKIAITSSGQNEFALRTHIKKALRSGCSADEIEHAILLTAPSAGFPVMMEAILVLRNVLEETE